MGRAGIGAAGCQQALLCIAEQGFEDGLQVFRSGLPEHFPDVGELFRVGYCPFIEKYRIFYVLANRFGIESPFRKSERSQKIRLHFLQFGIKEALGCDMVQFRYCT